MQKVKLLVQCSSGDVEKDFWLGFDMLQSPKDHVEFTLVRDWLQDALSRVCMSVVVDVPKTVMKHGVVQHLYSLLSGTLSSEKTDAELLVCRNRSMHPCSVYAACFLTYPISRYSYLGIIAW